MSSAGRLSLLTVSRRARRAIVLASLAIATAAPLAASASQPVYLSDLRKFPPIAEKGTLTLLDKPSTATPAVLAVAFRNDPRVRTSVTVRFDRDAVTLHDDGANGDAQAGDGVFSAVVTFDADALQRSIATRNQALEKNPVVPIFDKRQVVSHASLSPIALPLQPGVALDLSQLTGLLATIDPARELMIRHPSVVEDPTRTFDPCTGAGTPMGPWTFGYLMTQMANQSATGLDPAVFTRRWLQRWEFDQVVNDFLVPRRLDIQNDIINPWPKLADGRLDLARAPFRLLAIVNRVDLRENLLYGGGSAGELRFVFGALNLSQCNSPLQFTVIFEYGVKQPSCSALVAYAQQWHNLGSLVIGSAAYNAALQAITDPVVVAGADPSKPNGSALNQLRTNEIAIAPPGGQWELREFKIDPLVSGHLSEVTVKQTPSTSLNNQAVIRDFINDNEAAILAGTYVVPLDYPGMTPFLGGSSITPFGVFWNGPAVINNLEARHLFSLGTCNGCHAGETNTAFTHVKPRPAGVPSALSDFLTGLNQPTPNPVPPPASHVFGDLDRRAQDLDALVNSSCLFQVFQRPLLMSH
ncbi:MAG: choice-of-anchor X domain-containing protein [Sulfurifustis sp.]